MSLDIRIRKSLFTVTIKFSLKKIWRLKFFPFFAQRKNGISRHVFIFFVNFRSSNVFAMSSYASPPPYLYHYFSLITESMIDITRVFLSNFKDICHTKRPRQDYESIPTGFYRIKCHSHCQIKYIILPD